VLALLRILTEARRPLSATSRRGSRRGARRSIATGCARGSRLPARRQDRAHRRPPVSLPGRARRRCTCSYKEEAATLMWAIKEAARASRSSGALHGPAEDPDVRGA